MASAFHAVGRSEGNGTPTATFTSSAVATTIDDLIEVSFDFEGANGATVTEISDDQGNTLSGGDYVVANALDDLTSPADMHGAKYYAKATATGTVTVTVTISAARPWWGIGVLTATPSAGTELVLDAATAPAEGSSSTPTAGTASSSTSSGFATTSFHLYGGRTLTGGTGWTVPAGGSPTSSQGVVIQYRVVSATGSITFDGTLNASNEYIAQGTIYKEQSTGGAPFELVAEQPIAMTGELGISAALDIVTAQILVPASDVSAGSWSPSSGVDLYAMLDEADPSDSDYILTSTLGDECTVALQAGSDPFVSTGHVVRYRLRGDGSSGITVALLQGASLIASWTHDPAPSTFTTFEQTLSGGEADSITDYTALRLRFTEV